MGVKANLQAVRALIADAEPVPTVRAFQGDPEPGMPRGGVHPGRWHPDALGLPPECPVVPLGVDGSVNYFLDPIGQLYAYVKPYGQADTLELFRGRHNYLYWAWPKFSKRVIVDERTGEEHFVVDAWRNEKVRECMIAAATAKGSWSAADKVRGRGAWVTAGGQLILHCGNRMVRKVDDKRPEPPGAIEGFVYPTRPPIPAPWPLAPGIEVNPAKLLRPLLASWNWARPDIDPHLALGWIGCGYLAGALDWSANIYVTGDKSCGKSTLLELLKGVFGDWLLTATNTTAAGIYQHTKQDSLPVWVDEFEAAADNTKAKALLLLARQASSGGRGLRGGDRGTGTEFTISSAFAFSSINAPPLEPQDMSRFALLQLKRLPKDAKAPEIDPQALGVIGRMIQRQLMREWPRYQETYQAFRAELAAAGMDSRGQDTFGTLLACADLIEHDGWNEERLKTPIAEGDVRPWREVMAVGGMVEFEDQTENWRVCLNHLLTAPVDAWRNGNKVTVGQVAEAWFKKEEDYNNIVKVRKELGAAGIGLQALGREGDWLVIPNSNPVTRRLFEGSKFCGEQGAGVWSLALRQGPDDVQRAGQCKVNGVKSRCTLISLEALYGPSGLMVDDPPPDPDPTAAKLTPPPRP